MKILLLALVLAILSVGQADALSLQWNTVTTDVDGNPLSPGNEVTSYDIHRCQSNNCNLSNDTVVGSVPATVTAFNIDSQPKPSTYFVTALNLSGESAESNTVRVTPPRSTIVVVVP